MTDRPLWQHGVTEIAEAVRTATHDRRRGHRGSPRRASTTVNPRRQRDHGRVRTSEREPSPSRSTRALAAGEDVGPLAGVPFCVKENIDLTWSASTNGWTFLADAIPSADATMVARLHGCRRHSDRPREHAGLRAALGHRQRPVRPHVQPVGSGPRARGLERWRRRRCRDRHGSPRTRQRLRRVTAAARVRGRRLRPAPVRRSHSCAGGRERAGAAVAAVLRRQRPDRAQRR